MAKEAKLNDLDIARLKKKVRALDKLEADTHELRIEIARVLIAARPRWPERGPNAKGWGDYLDAIGLTQQRAWHLMQLLEAQQEGFTDPVKPKPDRDTWCTPPELTTAIGEWDLDPCSNERSTVRATTKYSLEAGDDGLIHMCPDVDEAIRRMKRPFAETRVFINPPYSDVLPWVQGYKHTRFCFLVKFDPSTAWCEELLANTSLILFPRRTRIEFVAPEGVDSSSNQFPHGLFYQRAKDATEEIRAMCFEFIHKG